MEGEKPCGTQGEKQDGAPAGLVPFGLINTGAVCYFNTLVQCLLSCREFVRAAGEYEVSTGEEPNELAKTFKDLVTQAHAVRDSNKAAIFNASPALAVIMKTHKFFGRQQEDVSEGFDLVIEKLGGRFEELFESKWKTDIYCDACQRLVSENSDTMSRVIVEKDYVTYKFPGIAGFITSHLSKFEGYKCPRCKSESAEGVKFARLISPPKILVISFNKFLCKWKADIDDELTIRYGTRGENSRKFRLAAIARHKGGPRGGHYITLARRQNRSYMLNDTRFIEFPMMRDPDDYVMFFEDTQSLAR